MGSVFMVGGACFQARPARKPRTRHTSDRKLWWRGYEDGYTGAPRKAEGPAYVRGHQEGAGAAQRRVAIELRKGRDEARRDAAPELLGRLAASGTEV